MRGATGDKAPKRRRVVIEVDAVLFSEVERQMKTPKGVALYGEKATIRGRMGIVAEAWMKMNFDVSGVVDGTRGGAS